MLVITGGRRLQWKTFSRKPERAAKGTFWEQNWGLGAVQGTAAVDGGRLGRHCLQFD